MRKYKPIDDSHLHLKNNYLEVHRGGLASVKAYRQLSLSYLNFTDYAEVKRRAPHDDIIKFKNYKMYLESKKIIKSGILLLFVSLLNFGCNNPQGQKQTILTYPQANNRVDMDTAYFASGCFWCAEAIFESLKGVEEVVSGYAGGHTKNPSYEDSNTGQTGHAEAIEVIYDPTVINFATLVDVYFGSQDPTQVNGQGPDSGSQYRSIIFYKNKTQREIIEKKKEKLAQTLNTPIAAEVNPFEKFWEAEAYHQNYVKQHPQNSYVQNVSLPRLNSFKEKFPDLIK